MSIRYKLNKRICVIKVNIKQVSVTISMLKGKGAEVIEVIA